MLKEANKIIEMLSANKFYAECPCCGETILLQKTHLFYLDAFNTKAKETYDKYMMAFQARREKLRKLKESISTKSEVGARSVNIGLILERMLPSLEDFPFCCDDCRSLFDPVDYLVFEGLATGIVKKLLWIEIKTGDARLNTREREIKLLVEGKKLDWDIYNAEVDNEE